MNVFSPMTHITFEELDTFLAAVDASTELDQVLNVTQKQINVLGFDRFTYWLRWTNKQSKEPVGITTYPEHFINHYVANDYQHHDMVGRFSNQTNRPFKWSEISERFVITKMQKILFDDSLSVGIKAGASVPIHGPRQAQATFSVVNGMSDHEFNRLFQDRRHEIHIIATYVHEKIMSLGIDTRVDDLSLTKREVDILTWISRGKTYWETSKILGIQEDTVKKHMQRICVLLQVSNGTHAVVKAIINGLIIP